MSITLQITIYCGITALIVMLFTLLYKRADRMQINRFITKLLLYTLPLALLVGLFLFHFRTMGPVLNGISMENQLMKSFENVLVKPYKTMIMGNSRTYRGINPDMMDSVSYNFSFDNETFLEQYYKLLYLDSLNALPQRLILGVDYFEFSFLSQAMRSTYSEYFVSQYDSLMTVLSTASGVSYKASDNIDDWFNRKMSSIFGRGASQYLSYLGREIVGEQLQTPYLKQNGQYIISPVPKAYDGEFMSRSSKIEKYQTDKFEDIINFSKKKGIELILLMLPCREIELKCYTREFKDKLNNYFNSFENVKYINLSEIDGFKTKDYMDDTHLTPEAADRFSRILYKNINSDELIRNN